MTIWIGLLDICANALEHEVIIIEIYKQLLHGVVAEQLARVLAI